MNQLSLNSPWNEVLRQ